MIVCSIELTLVPLFNKFSLYDIWNYLYVHAIENSSHYYYLHCILIVLEVLLQVYQHCINIIPWLSYRCIKRLIFYRLTNMSNYILK